MGRENGKALSTPGVGEGYVRLGAPSIAVPDPISFTTESTENTEIRKRTFSVLSVPSVVNPSYPEAVRRPQPCESILRQLSLTEQFLGHGPTGARGSRLQTPRAASDVERSSTQFGGNAADATETVALQSRRCRRARTAGDFFPINSSPVLASMLLSHEKGRPSRGKTSVSRGKGSMSRDNAALSLGKMTLSGERVALSR